MPPPVEDVSDDESTGGSIPYDDNESKGSALKKEEEEEEDKKENGQEDPAEPEYFVEKIMGHEWGEANALLYLVKWKNYDDPVDQTLEPEENLLEDVPEIVEEYLASIGGRPEKPEKTVRKRKSMAEVKPTPEKAEPKRRRKSRATTAAEAEDQDQAQAPAQEEEQKDALDWVPKTKNWDKEVKSVDTIIRDPTSGGLLVFLNWENGKKSKVSKETCYEKCPKKMLEFYESHLVFKDG